MLLRMRLPTSNKSKSEEDAGQLRMHSQSGAIWK
jgi:hypothetical protein